jgi:hypothetical protein
MSRSEIVKQIRPVLAIENTGAKTEVESFQNTVLRPTLKFQHELILSLVISNPQLKANLDVSLPSDEFLKRLLRILQKDVRLRNQLIGSVIALFTVEELTLYKKYEQDLAKRIIAMAAQRITDGYYRQSELPNLNSVSG